VLSVGQLRVVNAKQFVAYKRVDAKMPGLAFVDDIQLARLLPVKKDPGQQIVLIETPEPIHFHIAGETGAMGAR